MIVTQRASVQDLHEAVNSGKCASEGIVASQADRQVVWMRHLAHDGECPHSQLRHNVVFVIADDQHPMLAAAAHKRPDLSPPHHRES